MTLGVTMTSLKTLSITKYSIMTFSMTLRMKTLLIMAFSIMMSV
jgi:hypothetical protein